MLWQRRGLGPSGGDDVLRVRHQLDQPQRFPDEQLATQPERVANVADGSVVEPRISTVERPDPARERDVEALRIGVEREVLDWGAQRRRTPATIASASAMSCAVTR